MDDELMVLCKKFTKDHKNYNISSNAIVNALKRGGVKTINDLKNASIEHILKFRSIGDKKLDIIIKMKGEVK